MKKIISKRHPFKFYLTTVLGFVFFIFLATVMLFLFKKELDSGALETKSYFLPLASLCVYFIAFYTVYKYYKNAPIVELDEQAITIGKQTFSWSDVKRIELTGKWNFPFIGSFPMEAFEIEFNDGTSKVIFDDMYSNSWEIKSFIQNVIIDKKDVKSINATKASINDTKFEPFDVFKGNQFTSFRGIMLWGFMVFFAFILISKNRVPETKGLIFLVVMALFWFVVFSYQMNYFSCSKNFFIVKNHNFLWRNTIFKLTDIKEIVFETQNKQPNSLRVITKDFRNKLFLAGTLRDSNWLEMKRVLEKYNIEVRNECIPED